VRVTSGWVIGYKDEYFSRPNRFSSPLQPTTSTQRVILGIDPGTNVLGYSVISCEGSNVSLISMSTLHMKPTEDAYQKLRRIYMSLEDVIKLHKPTEMAVEAPFFGKNVQSMLKLGRAQGVAITAAMVAGLPVTEYSPKKIKLAITGNGNASKEQVSAMLLQMLKLKVAPRYFDATDACAVALCHFFQKRLGGSDGKSYSGWKDFASQNTKRVSGL
jgi:crossover junction endodeoxyribonuclease RuvC